MHIVIENNGTFCGQIEQKSDKHLDSYILNNQTYSIYSPMHLFCAVITLFH